ncbi:N-substituted formamide deformylase [Aestuariimicrobium sp. T2.26MG-19.2B]|nr:N-substituted formamide deformylase [Aestuariimicrobium sp. T2.26MG-19.2B]
MTAVTAISPALATHTGDAPDLVIRDARVLDLATGRASSPTDLHIVQRRISRRPGPSQVEEVDADGRFVIPGLWDAHVHMAQWAMCSRWVSVADSASAAEAASIVRAHLDRSRRTLEADTLVGFGFRDSRWPEPPTLEVLDEATGQHPTVLLSGDLHSAWLNSAAMARHGVTGSGHLVEEEAFALTRQLNHLPTAALDRRINETAKQAASRGVVGIVDMEMSWTMDEWRRRFAEGFQTLCVRPAIYPQWLERAIDEGLHSGDLLDPSGLLIAGPLKVVSDGSLTARTAYCCEPYTSSELGRVDPDRDRGVVNISTGDLAHLMSRAWANGIESAIHAIGDQAVSQVLDAFAATGARGSIEHAQLVRPSDITRMAQLGIRASVQPAHLLDDRDAMDDLWADRTASAFACASMAEAGVAMTFGSDAPVAPLDPWLAIQAAVTRSDGIREAWHAEQSLNVSQALLSSTRGVASLVPGAEADLLLLDENPFDVAPQRLAATRPSLTMLDGRITHSGL